MPAVYLNSKGLDFSPCAIWRAARPVWMSVYGGSVDGFVNVNSESS